MAAGRNVRDVQHRNGIVSSRLRVQMNAQTVTHRRRRVFGGPLLRPETPAAPLTALEAKRLLVQSADVARQLALAPSIAGPGTIQ